MYQDLKGKTAIVTGSSKGIGQAIALRFGQEQMNVIVNYKGDEEGLKKQYKPSSSMEVGR